MNLLDHLSQYALYHRDVGNIRTHFVGIPLIVWAIVLLLSRPIWWISTDFDTVPKLMINPSLMLILIFYFFFYLPLDRRTAHWMLAFYTLCWLSAVLFMRVPTESFYAIGVGAFVVGWIIQFIGHYYEGKKPAFFDDIRGLLVGPLFVLVETAFAWGWWLSLQKAIEEKVGAVKYPHGAPSFKHFGEFYPYYLNEHRHPTCRLLHFIGSWLVVLTLITTVISQYWLALWALPVIGYGFAWMGHFAFEKNRPATFRYPIMSLVGDWVMWWTMNRQIVCKH